MADALRVNGSVTSVRAPPELQPVQSPDQLLLCVQINVSYNNIDQPSSLEVIAAMKGKSMVSIGMAACNLGQEGARAMAELVSVMGSITSLLLAKNEFGDDGAEALSIGLKENKSLETLDLSGKGYGDGRIGPRGATALASAIAVMGSITSVR